MGAVLVRGICAGRVQYTGATYFWELWDGLRQNGEELALVCHLARLDTVHCLHASDHRIVEVLQLQRRQPHTQQHPDDEHVRNSIAI